MLLRQSVQSVQVLSSLFYFGVGIRESNFKDEKEERIYLSYKQWRRARAFSPSARLLMFWRGAWQEVTSDQLTSSRFQPKSPRKPGAAKGASWVSEQLPAGGNWGRVEKKIEVENCRYKELEAVKL